LQLMKGTIRVILLGCAFLAIVSAAWADEDAQPKPEDWDRRLEMLRSIPYLELSDTESSRADTGVVFYNPQLACQGYNLYISRRSGLVHLMDMNGHDVHLWDCSQVSSKGGYHHVRLLEDGNLYVIRESVALLKIDWNNKLIWEKKLAVHHDIAPLDDGSFYVPYRQVQDYRDLKVSFDSILHLDQDGEEINRWSTYEHLDEIKEALDTRPFLDTILDSLEAGASPRGGISDDVKKALGREKYKKIDYFHLNTVDVLPDTPLGERDPRFAAGNLLVCFRNVNQIAILERGTYRILWSWGAGELEWPHKPSLLPNGHILIFDNGVERKSSRVIELKPLSGEIIWGYMAATSEDFYTSGGGSAQRMPNRNTLICETNSGRAFEVDRRGNLVWLWLNPATWRRRRETVYRMERLPPEMVEPLLEKQRPREPIDHLPPER
jgi:hypothetical protein